MSLGDPIEVPAGAELAGIAVRLHMHSVWARIAIAHAENAAQAAPVSEDEFDSGLVAVTATAFALESFKALLVEGHGASECSAGPVPQTGPNAGNYVVGTMESSLGVSLAEWAANVVELFTLRNLAVHHEPTYKDPGWHPSGTGVAVEQAAFRSDVSRDAARTLIGVYEICASSASIPDIVQELTQMLRSLRARDSPCHLLRAGVTG